MELGQASNNSSDQFRWIEILLDTPIPDGRHRIISTVLAPYLINVKGYRPQVAEKAIEVWVDRCETYDAVRGNVKAFIKRSCLEAFRLKKKPKDLSYFKAKHNKLYRDIVDLASYYGLSLE